MPLLEDLGVSGFFGDYSLQGITFWLGLLFAAFVLLIFVGGITFFFVMKKNRKISYKNQIPIFANINGKHTRIGIDQAKEIFVPDSNISLFFLKNNKTYLARPTRAMGKNEFWYSISENGEWINFDMSMDPKLNTLAEANYDHRDTRYAYVNLKEIIKKNYKEKTQVWWKDPVVMNIISFVIMSIIFVGACWFLISKMGSLIGETSNLIGELGPISENILQATKNAQNINSGVVGA